MKKYLVHVVVSLVVVSGSVLATQAYRKDSLSDAEMKSKVEVLEERAVELEKSNAEQSKIIENLKVEIAQTKDEQIKKLQEDVAKLQAKAVSGNTKQLESKITAVEKSVGESETSVEDSAGTAYFFGKAMDATRATGGR